MSGLGQVVIDRNSIVSRHIFNVSGWLCVSDIYYYHSFVICDVQYIYKKKPRALVWLRLANLMFFFTKNVVYLDHGLLFGVEDRDLNSYLYNQIWEIWEDLRQYFYMTLIFSCCNSVTWILKAWELQVLFSFDERPVHDCIRTVDQKYKNIYIDLF